MKKVLKTLYMSLLALVAAFVFCACAKITPPPSDSVPGGNEQELPTDPETPSDPDRPQDPPLWASTYTLNDKASVKTRLLEIYGDEEKMYLLGNAIQRMPCPENGEYMVFNMRYEVGDYAKTVLEDAVDEFNEVFAVVNPNYKFKINYSPAPADFDGKYSIRMNITDNFSSPTVMGTAQMSTGEYLANFGITLKDTTLDDLRYLMLTFRHEFMHLLGAGDAYDNPKADKTTVMQNYNNTTYRHFSQSDVAFIDAYYRNPNNPKSDDEIKAYIANYEQNNPHTQSDVMAKIMNSAIDATDIISQLDALHYADTTALIRTLESGEKLDPLLGTYDVGFDELSYAEGYGPEKTYAGKFEVADGKYWEYKGIGGMGVSYTDCGNGLLIAMPGGTANMTLFTRFGDHILAFRPVGMYLGNDWNYFIDLSEFSPTLLRAYKVR